jgi:glycosyltransferase involved in cell wall biosynthesis
MLSGIKKRAFSFLISRFTKGIVLSNSLKSNLTPFIDSSKIFVLPNFAEDYLVSQKLKVNTDQLRIIFLSNLMKEKGILILLDALHALEKNKIKYVAKIAGNIDVDSYQEIISKVKRLEKTTYLGVVEGDRKKELLNWGNVFVLPTFYKIEGQPISIIEAMATKNVIITTAHSGIPDIVSENKNGFFVDKKKVAPLIERLMFLSSRKDIIKKIY